MSKMMINTIRTMMSILFTLSEVLFISSLAALTNCLKAEFIGPFNE